MRRIFDPLTSLADLVLSALALYASPATMNEVQLLSSAPIAGSVEEVPFDAVGTCNWVRFVDDDYREWCGVFGRGFTQHVKAVMNQAGHCFVISSGQGYIVDVNSRALLHKSENGWLVSVISIPQTQFFIACDYTHLIAYSPAGVVWESERVSVDGIKFLEVSESTVKGQVWDLRDWVDFVLEIKGWKYHSNYVCDF